MADYNAYLVPGVIVAYVAGILQPFVTRTAAFACILAGPLLSIAFERTPHALRSPLQGFHRAGLATLACYGGGAGVSLLTQHERDSEREHFTWGRFKQRTRQTTNGRLRPWWQNDKLWAALLVVCTLAMCWFFA